MKKSARILIVDDEKNMRGTLAEILADEGYHVRTAESGEAAVEICQTSDFQVILMDVRMPGINGVEAFRIIRRKRRDARVILMSAYSVDELRRAALDEGAVAFLPKPLNLESVVGLIAKVANGGPASAG